MRCEAITRSGSQCKADALPGATWCYSHHPDKAEERRRNASKGGRTGGNGRPSALAEVQDAKNNVKSVLSGLLRGQIEPRLGGVLLSGFNVLARLIEQERRIRADEELEGRIEALEEMAEEEHRWATGG